MIKVEVAYSGMNSVSIEFADEDTMWAWWNSDTVLVEIKPKYWINKNRVQDIRIA